MSGQGPSACLVVRSLARGGAERQAVILARGLQERHVSTSVLLFYGGGSLEADLAGTGVEIVHLRKGGRWHVVGLLVRLVRALRERRPQVVYGFMQTPTLLLALTRPLHGRPIAVGLFSAARPRDGSLLKRIELRLEPVAARLAEVVITKSSAGLEDAMARGFPRHKLHVVPNGVDGSRLRFDAAARKTMRQSYPGASPIVGIVGRLDPIKDHETFLAAFALLLPAHPEAVALVVGLDPGGRSAELRAIAEKGGFADRVIFTGAVDDVAAVYSGCDVVVCSSRSESGPAVLLEALACGTPCASTDVGHMRSTLGDRLVAPVADPPRLAAAIEAALSLPTDDEARQARRSMVLAEYGSDRMISETAAALGLRTPSELSR